MSYTTYSPVILTSDSPVPLIPSTFIPSTIPTFTTLPPLPLITSLNPLISFPLHPSLDLNRDRKLHKKMTDYFYYKTLDKWLKKEKDMLDLLNYLKVDEKGNVKLIGNINDYKSTNIDTDNQLTTNKKVEYIEKYILNKDDIYYLLKKYIKETNTNWYDLENAAYFIKEMIRKLIKKKIVDNIENKKK